MRIKGYTIINKNDQVPVKFNDIKLHTYGRPVFFKNKEDLKIYMKNNELKESNYSIEEVERDGYGYLLVDKKYIGSTFNSRISYSR